MSLYVVNEIGKNLQLIDQESLDYLHSYINSYRIIYSRGVDVDPSDFALNKKICIESVNSIKELFEEHKKKLIEYNDYSVWQWSILFRTLEIMKEAINFDVLLTSDGTYYGYEKRDQLMFESIKWLIKNKYQEKKIIIWAHNAHIEKGGLLNKNVKNMGHYLAEEYGDQYYSIGFFAYQGKVYNGRDKEIEEFENLTPNSIEHQMNNFSNNWMFEDLSNGEYNWYLSEVTGKEIENGDAVQFIPSERFDAIINFDKVDCPNFINK